MSRKKASLWKRLFKRKNNSEKEEREKYEALLPFKKDELEWRAAKSNYRIVKEYDGYAVEYNKLSQFYSDYGSDLEDFYYHKEDRWTNDAPVSPDDIKVDGKRQLSRTFLSSASLNIGSDGLVIGGNSSRGYSTRNGHYFETLEEAQMALEISLELYNQNLGRERFEKQIVEEY